MPAAAYPAFYPYRDAAARERCVAYLRSLADRKWPIASEERVVPTAYGDTFVRISGPAGAPPLVLLHGAAGTSVMWAANVGALSAAFRTFAVDQVNDFGRSTLKAPMRSMKDYVAWMHELFDGLQLGADINLVGLSYGGGLAAQYALRHPERLGKLVLLAPGNTVLRVSWKLIARIAVASVTRGRKGFDGLLRWMFVDTAPRNPGWVEQCLEMFRMNLANTQRRRWPPFPPVLSDAEWRSLRMPTLFLVGEHEVIYAPAKAVRRLQRVAPGVTAEVVKGADHDVAEAQPEFVNARILEFLGAATVAYST